MKTTLTVDQAGRVVLPKSVRSRFHLTRGSALHLELESDAIVLKPEETIAPLVQRGALLVHQGTATGDLMDVVSDTRARRDQDVSRWPR